jgi:hypothetical protein
MVIPASDRLFAYLGSAHYQQPRAEALERARERGIVFEPTRRT